MFENSGESIRVLAKVEMVLSLIAAFICAILLGQDYNGHVHVGRFFGWLIGISFLGWVMALFLHAMGDVVCYLESIAEVIKNGSAVPSVAEPSRVTNTSAETVPAPVKRVSGDWVCPSCGRKNTAT